MDPLAGLVQVLGNSCLWGFVGLLSLAFSLLVNAALGKKLGRQQIDRLLESRRHPRRYHELLQVALGLVDRWLTPAIGPSPETREAEGRRAWSWPLLDFSLRLAIAYPPLTVLLIWAISGTDEKLGSQLALPSAGWLARGGVLAGLALLTWLVLRSRRAQAQGKTCWFIAYLVVAGGVAFIVTGAVLAAVTDAMAVAVIFIVVLPVVVAGVVAVAVPGPVAVPIALALASTVPVALALASPAPFTLVVAVPAALALKRLVARTRFGLLAYAGLVVLPLGALAVAVRLMPDLNPSVATWLLLVVGLPLLNAVLVFLSFGLTRWLLRRGAVSPAWPSLAWALGNVASALGLAALLGLALVAAAQWMNGLDAAPLLDLMALLTDIHAEPEAYWWLQITLLSTLLPTLAHLVLASFGTLLAIMPEGVALFIRRQLPRIEVDAMARWLAFWTLSAIGFLAIAAVALALHGLVSGASAAFPHLGRGYLWLLERFAAWLGASDPPGSF